MEIESKIQNSRSLTDLFGRWPSFHDAEVLRLTLDRGEARSFNPNLQAAIHVFEMTSQIDEQGMYVLKGHVVATFLFFEIIEVRLEDFTHQNVLQNLSITDISDQQLERVKFHVAFNGIFGVTAEFHCRSIRVESVEPYVPK